MWKKVVFLFLIVCLLATLVSCSGVNPVVPPVDEGTTDEEFYEGTTDEEFNDIIDTGENAVDKFEEYCNSIGEEQAYQATVDFLEQQNGVKEAGIGEDGTTIWFEYENGYLVGIFSTEEDERANEKGISLPFDQSKVMPSAEKALILDPGFSPAGSFKTIKIEWELLSLYGKSNCDTESGLDVSIELMKELYKYSVVYIVTHGGFIKDYLVFALSVRATTDIKDQYDYYFTKKTNKYLVTAFIDGEPYVGITPSFIRECNSGTFPDSLICINACHSLEDPMMAKAFLDKGAYAYCGYTTTMDFRYDAPVEFFENLISEEMNVEDAIDNLSNANNFDYYPKNPENHGDLYLTASDQVSDPVHNLTKDTYYNTILYALNDADSNDIIEVSDGIYDEKIIFPPYKKVTLQSVNGAYSTTIRGDDDYATVNAYKTLEGTTIEGFTITHADGLTGAGINLNKGNLSINNCIISGNTTGYTGGGIKNFYGNSLTITGSTISGNTAGYHGGGIFIPSNPGTISIGGDSADEKNTLCGNRKSGYNPSLDQQIGTAAISGSLYETYKDTNYISAYCE